MIIWLASYPKSGNTWVRLFLDSLFNSSENFNINQNFIEQFPLRSNFFELTNNVNDQEEFAKHCISAQQKLNLDNKIKIFKTHNALWNWKNGKYSFTNENETLGVIHIVRDPRNVVTSILNYFHKKNYQDAIEFMRKDRILGGDENEHGLPTIIGSWSNHYKSWKKFKKNYLLIKYEDLIKKNKEEFFKITNYLNSLGDFKFSKNNISKAIKNCEFENLSKQEDKFGFISNSDTNKKLNQKFFNLGPNNDWKKILNKEYQEEIENLFGTEMKDVGYI